MRGRVKTRERCPKCRKSFNSFPDFECPRHKTRPRHFYVKIYLQGFGTKQIKSDPYGRSLNTLKDALTLWAAINKEIKDGIFEPKKYVRLPANEYWISTLLDRFLAYKSREIKPSYQGAYKLMVTRAKAFWDKFYIRDLRRIHVLNYRDHLAKTIGGKTLKNHMDNFKTFLHWVRRELEMIDRVPDFPVIDYEDPPPAWLSQEDQVKMMEAIPEYARPLIGFLMLHGCRPGEARALKCKDVNLKTRTVNIHATFSQEIYSPRRKGKKAKPVVLPIHQELAGYIEARVKGNLPEAWLFHNPQTGDHYRLTTLRKIWDRARKRAGISGLRLYDATRHSVASQLINGGATLYDVKEILGHSSTKTTERYAHQSLDNLRVKMEMLSLKAGNVVEWGAKGVPDEKTAELSK